MVKQYILGLVASLFLGFWGAQAIIYFYVSQIEFELNAAKRRRNLVSAIKVSAGTAVVVAVVWFLQKFIFS